MKKVFFILIVALSFLFNSCKKKNASIGREYFIFGTHYSECAKNCSHYFILIGDHLYPYNDKLPVISQTNLATRLTKEKFKLADALEENFPQFLEERPNCTFGCPDCRDQGEINIEIREHGKIKKWRLDADISQNPEEIREYGEKVQELVLYLEK
jgi:hypothetical protein